jgi:TatA/E family protein of Tat protein translocase
MFSLSPIKIMMIVAVVVILLGPDKLPEVAHKLGATWRAIKKMQQQIETEVRSAIPDLPSTSELANIARSPIGLLNKLADRVEEKTTPDAVTETSDATEDNVTRAPSVTPTTAHSSTPSPTNFDEPFDPSLN